MFKLLLISIVFVPVLLGMQMARARRRRSAVSLLLGTVAAYQLFYLVMLYYLRLRWVG